uniref:Transmembrane protein 209 n=1 Tax=Biomphalaria glabrata TaxID=6526 RepID=A0A2C9LDM6_BIOGL
MSSYYQSDVVEYSWRKLHMTRAARQALMSCLKTAFIFVLLFTDMSYSVFSGMFSMVHPVFWFVELSIAILLLFQLISNGLLLVRYFWLYFFGSAVEVTEEQRKLMAIPQTDKNFFTPPKKKDGNLSSISPLSFNQSSSYNFGDNSPHRLNSSYTSPSPNRYHTPLQHSTSMVMSPYSSLMNSSSLHTSYNTSMDMSLNMSGNSVNSGLYDVDRSSSRSRRSASVPVNTKSSKYSRITDVSELHKYIHEEEEKERNRSQVSLENVSSGNTSFWNYGSSPLDFSYILRRFAYQLSPRSSAAPTQSSSNDQSTSHGVGEVWKTYGVTEDDLYIWIEKLRKWISFTIVTRLNTEIDEINAALQKIGCEDSLIGEVGVATLKQLALTKGTYVPTLNSVVSYLDFTPNQEYLRTRIRDLSTGSMSAYTWDRGGNYGKPWNEHLTTDAALVMHLFCCYMDSRLPAQPRYPDGKSFTAQHFVKTPDKPSLDRKDNLQIYQSCINPPHFQVVIGSQIYNLSKGRNNMFQAILLFLYHIKVKESGMLGRVNLGMSGLNMLWIFD